MKINLCLLLVCALGNVAAAQPQIELLTRGIVAVPGTDGGVLVSWRLLDGDPQSIAFNLYALATDGDEQRINSSPIVEATNFLIPPDLIQPGQEYFVKELRDGVEVASSAKIKVWKDGFLEIPIAPIEGYRLGDASVADLDGRDEIVYQAMVIDDNGQGLHTSGLRHGDAMHISDMDPRRGGLEIFSVQENEEQTVRFKTPGAALRDAQTGKVLWSHSPGIDVGAGLAADIDPEHLGYEAWGGPGGLRNCRGEEIGPAPRSTRFAIWWDGDLLRELLDGGKITKWNWREHREERLFQLAVGGRRSSGYPCLMGDLLGDWREEVLVPSPDGRALRLYTTPHLTHFRLKTLMHDRQYRLSIAWQNVVYNKPPHPSFFLGEGMFDSIEKE